VWHIIIGVGIINRIIINIIIALLIFSCGGISKINKKSKGEIESKINIKTQYWNTTEDSLNFYVHISIPLNHFVFRKQMDHFSSEIIYTLIISDDEGKTQLYRESWRELFSEPYYENTRDPDNYFMTEKNISLIPGEYNLFLNVQDEDSRKNWQIVKEIELKRVNYLSPALLFIKDKYGKINQVQFIMEKIDTLWLRTQVNLPEAKLDIPPGTDDIIPAQNKDYNGKYIAILDLDPIGVNEIDSKILTESLTNIFIELSDYKVVERTSIDKILKEQKFQHSGCTNSECAVEIGQLLNADLAVIGTIGELGSSFTIQTRIINVETGVAINSADFSYKGEIDELLNTGIKSVVRELLNFDNKTKNYINEIKSDYSANLDINYTVSREETIIDSGEVAISDTAIQNLYYLPIPLNQHKWGRYEIELQYLNDKQITSFQYALKTKFFWTDEIDELVGVMKYILPYSEYKMLKQKGDSEKLDAINKYWKKKDPTPKTDENELLNELNERVKFSNKNFSIIMQGWRSDRGRIYIIYGKPQVVDESYQDNRGYNFQKWVYANGKEFLFIDRTMSGDYTLYHERF